jgi:hypothetical protein
LLAKWHASKRLKLLEADLNRATPFNSVAGVLLFRLSAGSSNGSARPHPPQSGTGRTWARHATNSVRQRGGRGRASEAGAVGSKPSGHAIRLCGWTLTGSESALRRSIWPLACTWYVCLCLRNRLGTVRYRHKKFHEPDNFKLLALLVHSAAALHQGTALFPRVPLP